MSAPPDTGGKPTLQFPLALLAYGKTYKERLDVAISHAVYVTGSHRMKSLSESQIKEAIASYKDKWPKDKACGFDEQALKLGGHYCNVQLGSFRGCVESHDTAKKFLSAWEAKGRNSPIVRVSTTMVFEARDGTEKNYRRFAALCAANTAIGSKPFAVVTRGRIRAGTLGYSGRSMLFDEDGNLTDAGKILLGERDDDAVPMTDDQVRTLLDNLVRDGLLTRYNPYRGSLTYYSKWMPAEMIAGSLLNKANRTAGNVSNPKIADLGEQLRQIRQGARNPLVPLCGDADKKAPHNGGAPHNGEVPTQAPPGPHPSPTQAPHNAASFAASLAAPNVDYNAGARVRVGGEIQQGQEKQSPNGHPTQDEVEQRGYRIGASPLRVAMYFEQMEEAGWKDADGKSPDDWRPAFDAAMRHASRGRA